MFFRHTILGSMALLGVCTFGGCGVRQERTGTQSQALEGSSCPDAWLDASPPNPSWPTLSSIVPIQYNDTEIVFSFFPAPLDDLQTLVPPSLHPLPVAEGVGLFGAFFLKFEDIAGLHPYREAHVSVLVADSSLYEGYSSTVYSQDVIVTTKQSQWVGIQGWGMNKILGNPLCHRVPPNLIRCMVEVDGKLVMKMELNTDGLTSLPPAALATVALTTKDNQLVRTPFLYELLRSDAMLLGTYEGGHATLQFGDHPIGQQLANLRIGRTSANSVWGEHLHAALPPGVCSPL